MIWQFMRLEARGWNPGGRALPTTLLYNKYHEKALWFYNFEKILKISKKPWRPAPERSGGPRDG
jgi:hypothetical protein